MQQNRHRRIALLLAAMIGAARPLTAADQPRLADEHGDAKPSDVGADSLSMTVLNGVAASVERAAPQQIAVRVQLLGSIVPVESKTVHLAARFPGVVRDVKKGLGDPVIEGEPLAVIESNQNLQTFTLQSPLTGTITKSHVARGEIVLESSTVYELIDLSAVYAELNGFPPELDRVRVGQRASVATSDPNVTRIGTVSYISPLSDELSQSRAVRVLLTNKEGTFSPGQFAVAHIVLEEPTVPLAVQTSAVQTLEKTTIVFVKEGTRLIPRPVLTGRSDGTFTEVTSGLELGEEYVTGDTFILKAELGKGAAQHEH